MKQTLITLFFVFIGLHSQAQQARIDFKTNRTLSGSNYVAYPGPQQKKLTPAPKGYKPFYISHYGRHGSRYLIGMDDYDKPCKVLQRADSLGKLTALGKDVLRRLELIRREARGRDGELTQLGGEQHKGIAERMYRNFPEVFAGKVNVDAKSTVVIRCILSMENALQQLLLLNPKLHITHDASQHDMYYMNLTDKKLNASKMPEAAKKAYEAFSKKHENHARVMRELFNDDNYWQHEVNAGQLNYRLYKLASNVQSTELRHQLSLYDLFTDEEIYDNWLASNAWWYINYGPSPLNGGTQPYSQRNLLRKIISEADSCLALKRPGATLRYGHDTMVMPLVCLLELNGYGRQIADLEQLDDENWCDYRIFPMGCNLQFVFYRKRFGDSDILFKVLHNEKEATLPIATDMPPYYHWNDFKAYFLKKLADYKE
ncbi:MAG TPA: histidine-type phosphatase [Prevotella sp.]